MSAPIVLTTERQIAAALADDRLVPPAAPDAGGSTLALRAAMARFSGPADHPSRRAAVVGVIESIDVEAVAVMAAGLTRDRLCSNGDRSSGTGGPTVVEVMSSIARLVTVEAIARSIGAHDDELAGLVHDVDRIVQVIGRGGPPTAESDAATDRLMTRFASHPSGPVAVISALYQSMDATAALVAVTVLREHGRTAVPIARTKRVATEPTTIDGVLVAAGSVVEIELGAAGLCFGAGPHACPGRALAEAIAASITTAMATSGCKVDLGRTVIDPDGRPAALWLRA